MKKVLVIATLASIALSSAMPAYASFTTAKGLFDASIMDGTFDKRKKKRIPGGSGCDDARDLIEHPECRV